MRIVTPKRRVKRVAHAKNGKRRTTSVQKVSHIYRDWSDATIQVGVANGSKRYTRSDKFPAALYRMLMSLEDQGTHDIIAWQPHGRAFIVHDRDRFASILMSYFDTNKIQSFQRQLNLYDFKRLSSGRDKHAYYHPLFLRGKPNLLKMIHRSTHKGVGIRLQPNPTEEPCFWFDIPWVIDGRKESSVEQAKRLAAQPDSVSSEQADDDCQEDKSIECQYNVHRRFDSDESCAHAPSPAVIEQFAIDLIPFYGMQNAGVPFASPDEAFINGTYLGVDMIPDDEDLDIGHLMDDIFE